MFLVQLSVCQRDYGKTTGQINEIWWVVEHWPRQNSILEWIKITG